MHTGIHMVLLLRDFLQILENSRERVLRDYYYYSTWYGHLLVTKTEIVLSCARAQGVCTDKHHHSNYAQSADEV